jgi:hypothetical protein
MTPTPVEWGPDGTATAAAATIPASAQRRSRRRGEGRSSPPPASILKSRASSRAATTRSAELEFDVEHDARRLSAETASAVNIVGASQPPPPGESPVSLGDTAKLAEWVEVSKGFPRTPAHERVDANGNPTHPDARIALGGRRASSRRRSRGSRRRSRGGGSSSYDESARAERQQRAVVLPRAQVWRLKEREKVAQLDADAQTLAEMWQQIDDAGGSGVLERPELSRLLIKVGKKLSQRQVDAAMDEIDQDGSGAVSFLEFERWVMSTRLLGGGDKSKMATGHVPFVRRAASMPLLPQLGKR